jgi:hypothetical protein
MYHYIRFYPVLLPAAILFMITACTSRTIPPEEGGYYHQGIYFGANLTRSYKKGIRDGCKTARGFYTKSHYLFNNNSDYANGWFLGRNRCRGLLKINENGDLIE